jgi:NAD-dependent SIR2 family protein deacetylase
LPEAIISATRRRAVTLPFGHAARDRLVHALLVLTGAGVSAESGVPTLRDANGLWENHSIEQVATPQGFEDDPALVWRFYWKDAARRRP